MAHLHTISIAVVSHTPHTTPGRQGVSAEVVANLLRYLSKHPIAKLKATGAAATNMRVLTQELEQATRGIVIHRSGSVMVLFRGYLDEY